VWASDASRIGFLIFVSAEPGYQFFAKSLVAMGSVDNAADQIVLPSLGFDSPSAWFALPLRLEIGGGFVVDLTPK